MNMENEHKNQDLVTLTTVNQQAEAYMLKSFLEEAGFMVFLQNEMTAQLYGNAAGGVSIQVPDTEAEKARNLLIEAGYIK